MRVGFMGRTRPLLDTIQLIHASSQHEVAFIWTSKAEKFYGCDESEFQALAEKIGCPFYLTPKVNKVSDKIDFDGVDIIFSINFVNLIPQSFFERIKHGVVNAHPGDLPRYKGNACPNWAILNDEDRVVLTVHEMSAALDAGPVYLKKELALSSTTTITEIYAWLAEITPQCFMEVFDLVEKGKRPHPQQPDRSFRCFPRKPEDSRILWAQGVEKIARLVRASTYPFAGAYCFLNSNSEQKVVIHQAHKCFLDYDFCAIDGQILEREDNAFVVSSCGEAMMITAFQLNDLSQEESFAIITASMRNRLT